LKDNEAALFIQAWSPLRFGDAYCLKQSNCHHIRNERVVRISLMSLDAAYVNPDSSSSTKRIRFQTTGLLLVPDPNRN